MQRYFVEVGQRYNRGVIIEYPVYHSMPSYPRGYLSARLLCDCGAEYVARPDLLVKGRVKSCGCLQIEAAIATGHRNVRHGLAAHPLYRTWWHMLNRCENPRARQYPTWGARGIRVCERWHDLRLFVKDIEKHLGPRPAGMSLDRTNNDGDYEIGNVRWATPLQQARNRRNCQRGAA